MLLMKLHKGVAFFSGKIIPSIRHTRMPGWITCVGELYDSSYGSNLPIHFTRTCILERFSYTNLKNHKIFHFPMENGLEIFKTVS